MADPSSELISVEEALARLTRGVEPLSGEMVPLNLADGRVLSEDLVSKRTQPPFPASAMDGYAVRGADVTALPAKLRVIGESVAGRGYHSPLKPGTAVRIFTGAPVPEGADTIIIQENTNRSEEVVEILDGEQVGRYIRQRGLDFAEGDRLLEAGTRLSPFKLSLAASANFPEVPCVKKPVVAFIATGDELREPGSVLQGDQIICSNSYGIAAIANRMGASVRDLGIVGDEMEPLLAAFRRAISDGAHIIVTTGGASVGDRDLVGDALEQLGVTMGFWKIAMRPGKPLMYGQRQTDGRTVRFLGLPGNPVSSLVGSKVFLEILICALLGTPQEERIADAVTATDLPENDRREDYLRATLERLPDGTMNVTAFDRQDSSMLKLAAYSDALLIRPSHAPAAKSGDPCRILLLD